MNLKIMEKMKMKNQNIKKQKLKQLHKMELRK